MKKSERYYMAMLAVINSNHILSDEKLEIIETLMDDKGLAEWSEKAEEEKEAAEQKEEENW